MRDKPSNHLKLRIDDLKVFEPLTANQKKFFDTYKDKTKFIALHGVAGTGKTFCALYKALEEVLDKGNPLQKVVIIRSAVQSRDMGHLPGDVEDKMAIYKQPYIQICDTLFGRRDAWDRLEEQNHIEFISTSFIRGTTFDNTILVVDEMQNMNYEEIDTVMTRVGNHSKILFCGDYRQTDLRKSGDKTGILKFLEIAKRVKSFAKIEFAVEDIVRSGLVKEYIIAKLHYEDSLE